MPCLQGLRRATHYYGQTLWGMVKHVPMHEYSRQERNGLDMERRKGEGIRSLPPLSRVMRAISPRSGLLKEARPFRAGLSRNGCSRLGMRQRKGESLNYPYSPLPISLAPAALRGGQNPVVEYNRCSLCDASKRSSALLSRASGSRGRG